MFFTKYNIKQSRNINYNNKLCKPRICVFLNVVALSYPFCCVLFTFCLNFHHPDCIMSHFFEREAAIKYVVSAFAVFCAKLKRSKNEREAEKENYLQKSDEGIPSPGFYLLFSLCFPITLHDFKPHNSRGTLISLFYSFIIYPRKLDISRKVVCTNRRKRKKGEGRRRESK